MRTGGTPRRGPAPGPALLTGVLLAVLTGCGGSGAPGDAAGAPETAGRSSVSTGAPVSPAATPPEDLCTRLVAHWSRKVLDGDTYGDYQSMGLSNRQYEIVRDIVDAARTERERGGTHAAERLIDRTARERCAERYRDGAPGDGPWS